MAPDQTKELGLEEWAGTELGRRYGELFYKRATGQLAEMESSKAAAKRILMDYRPGETVADIGCGAGHYLRSLRKCQGDKISYLGLDRTSAYVELAKTAFASDELARFMIGDVNCIDLPDQSQDIVMCNNVLLHLPSVTAALRELCRVAKRRVLIRTLVGLKSYVIKDVAPDANGEEFDDSGQPRGFHYLNIYSEAFIKRILRSIRRVKGVEIELDRDFSASAVADTSADLGGAWDATSVVSGMQVSGLILMPWSFIDVALGE